MRTFIRMLALGACLFACANDQTPDWKPAERWRGFNLLGMFRAPTMGLAKDPRVDGHFLEWEFKFLHDNGFNFARLPIDYRILVTGDSWTNLDESKMRHLDQAIAWGRRYDVHVQICLHRIPGFCVLDQTEAFPLGTSEVAQDAACTLWAAFARRWKDVPNESLSFNLFNEPSRHAGGRNYAPLAVKLINAIRREDPKRFIVADGNDFANLPVPQLYGIPAVGQAFRGYAPARITHYATGYASKGFAREPPTWPLVRGNVDPKNPPWEWRLPEEEMGRYLPKIKEAGEFAFVGEFGFYKNTPHAAGLAWMEHYLKLWRANGLGWALWNLRGPFGIMDSGRTDVEYEDFNGHKLDRKMLELLKRH